MIKKSEGKIWHFRKGLIDFSGNVIKSVFGIILLVLSVSSVIYTCELKNTETALEVTFYNRDNILKYIILCIIFLSVLLIKKRKTKAPMIFTREIKRFSGPWCANSEISKRSLTSLLII